MRTEKRLIRAFALTVATLPMLVLSSCSTTEDGSFVDPIKLTEKIGGNWMLNSITQVDETSGNEMTLTNLLGFDTFCINLSEGGQFSISGNAPKLIPTTGTWELDNNYVKSTGEATQLLLKGSEGDVKLTVASTPGATPELGFQLSRTSEGKAFLSYKYSLSPVE